MVTKHRRYLDMLLLGLMMAIVCVAAFPKQEAFTGDDFTLSIWYENFGHPAQGMFPGGTFEDFNFKDNLAFNFINIS